MAMTQVPAFQVVCDTCGLPAPAGLDSATASNSAGSNGFSNYSTTNGPNPGTSIDICQFCVKSVQTALTPIKAAAVVVAQ